MNYTVTSRFPHQWPRLGIPHFSATLDIANSLTLPCSSDACCPSSSVLPPVQLLFLLNTGVLQDTFPGPSSLLQPSPQPHLSPCGHSKCLIKSCISSECRPQVMTVSTPVCVSWEGHMSVEFLFSCARLSIWLCSQGRAHLPWVPEYREDPVRLQDVTGVSETETRGRSDGRTACH